MKNWKIPAVTLTLLILALIFRWGDLGSSTNNGTTTITKVNHWNGSVWQTTIKNGSYSERIVNTGWIESSRNPIGKTEQYKELVDFNDKADPLSFSNNNVIYITKTKTVQVPPLQIYWLSSNGLFKIWVYVVLGIWLWLIVAFIYHGRKIMDMKK